MLNWICLWVHSKKYLTLFLGENVSKTQDMFSGRIVLLDQSKKSELIKTIK
jgi:hypothetical protein